MPKALIVHDEAHISRLIEINLQREGYDVLAASDLQTAVRMVNDHLPTWSSPIRNSPKSKTLSPSGLA